MSSETARKVLWFVCLIIAPLVLAAIELFHPAGFTQNPGMFAYLSKPEPYDPKFQALAYPGPHWWFTLHMIQTPMVALVAVGLWLLVGKVQDNDGIAALGFAWLSRVSTFVFLVYYTALDSIGGSGLGRAILNTERLYMTSAQREGAVIVLNANWTDNWVGGVGSVISLTGSWAAFAAALTAAVALFLTKRVSWIPLLLLVGFGWELQMSHTMPHGPIAFSLLLAAAIWIGITSRPASLAKTAGASS